MGWLSASGDTRKHIEDKFMRKGPELCSLPECGRKYESRGYCAFHANRDRHGTPLNKPHKLSLRDKPKCKRCYLRVVTSMEEHQLTCSARDIGRFSKWAKANPEKWAAYQRKNRARNRVNYKVNKKLQAAVSSSRITKPSNCQKCGIEVTDKRRLQGHHPDYSKPLEVIWVCDSCHKDIHRAES
jgi:hypothetical protein